MTRSPLALRRDERGQTLQDFVVGISIFIVVVFLALAFFPQLLSGVHSTNTADNEAQADRIARQIVTNSSVPGTTNALDVSRIEGLMDRSEEDLQKRFNVNGTVSLNVSFVVLNGSDVYVETPAGVPLTSEPNHFDNEAGSAARIVTFYQPVEHCDPACRLEVRAW